MKINSLLINTFLVLPLSMPSFAMDSNSDSNPFLNESSIYRNSTDEEPRGVVIKDFENGNVPDFVEEKNLSYRSLSKDTSEKGFQKVEDGTIPNYKRHLEDFLSENKRKELKSKSLNSASMDYKIQNKIHTNPSQFRANGILVESQLKGTQPSGVFSEELGWSGSTRIYETEALGIVIIDENDLRNFDIGVAMDQNSINENVNGNPAILISRQDNSGNADSVLMWGDSDKFYTITINKSITDEKTKKALMRLASSIY